MSDPNQISIPNQTQNQNENEVQVQNPDLEQTRPCIGRK